jgi:hypothetical protein
MVIQGNTPKNWAGVVILISDKGDIKPKLVRDTVKVSSYK